MTNILDRFLIDGDQVDLDRLSELVDPFLQGIDKKSGNPYFKPSFKKVPSRTQILLFLLSKKVAHQLQSEWPEAASVSEIVKYLNHIPEGTIKPTLSQQLKNENLVSQDSQGKYFIPNHVLHGLSLENTCDDSVQKNTTVRNKKTRASKPALSSKNNGNELDLERETWEQFIEPLHKRGNYLERCLLVIKIARDNGNDQGISPAQIEWFLREKVRAPINTKNISYFLGKTSSSVTDRVKKGKSYFYRIMAEGERIVERYLAKKADN